MGSQSGFDHHGRYGRFTMQRALSIASARRTQRKGPVPGPQHASPPPLRPRIQEHGQNMGGHPCRLQTPSQKGELDHPEWHGRKGRLATHQEAGNVFAPYASGVDTPNMSFFGDRHETKSLKMVTMPWPWPESRASVPSPIQVRKNAERRRVALCAKGA